MSKPVKDLTPEEVSILKNMIDGSMIWGGCVIHLSKDFTGYDLCVWAEDQATQFNPETATGVSLRNLAALVGVYDTDNDTDIEVRGKIALTKSSQY